MKEYCTYCGEPLTNDNSIGEINICISCQNEIFNKLKETNGAHMSIFIMCAVSNMPCIPEICPEDIGEYKTLWEAYLSALADTGNLMCGDTIKGFYDGVSDIRKIFGRNVTEEDFGKYIAVENERAAQYGTAEQRKKWGTREIWRGMAMTRDVYDELDAQYESKVNDFRGQTITPEMENTLIDVSKMRVAASYLMSRGDDTYAKLLKSADDRLSSEQMRKKDEKPMEALRIDALVVALENAGLMENGQFLNYDETVNALRDNLIKSKKYDYSLDVADQVILDILNSMRANADLIMLNELPEEYSVEDAYGEFEEEETEREKEAKRYAGLTKVSIAKPEKKSKASKKRAN
ncbi:MAG: hypothetical protein KBS59_00330 [Clostridiales bacterium]|nr:hypothetical protein [Clostridiales bacterium]